MSGIPIVDFYFLNFAYGYSVTASVPRSWYKLWGCAPTTAVVARSARRYAQLRMLAPSQLAHDVKPALAAALRVALLGRLALASATPIVGGGLAGQHSGKMIPVV